MFKICFSSFLGHYQIPEYSHVNLSPMLGIEGPQHHPDLIIPADGGQSDKEVSQEEEEESTWSEVITSWFWSQYDGGGGLKFLVMTSISMSIGMFVYMYIKVEYRSFTGVVSVSSLPIRKIFL